MARKRHPLSSPVPAPPAERPGGPALRMRPPRPLDPDGPLESGSLTPLALTFAASGVWDTIAGILYFFVIGSGRAIDNPRIDPFFSVFLGSFFLCFAYLQFLSAFNIRRYAFNVGCLIIGRAFYVVQLYAFMGFVEDFPSTFWFTGIIDGLFTVLYLFFAVRGGLRVRDLFLPGA